MKPEDKEIYEGFEIKIFKDECRRWVYSLFGTGCQPYSDNEIESDEWFESDFEARFAAMLHIMHLDRQRGLI